MQAETSLALEDVPLLVALSSVVLGVTERADGKDASEGLLPLQDALRVLLETGLTEVVDGFSGIAAPFDRLGTGLASVDPGSLGYLEERVLIALGLHSLQLSQLVLAFAQLLLKIRETGAVDEQSVLRLEQLIVDASKRRGDCIELPNAKGSRDGLPCDGDGGHCRGQ